MVVATLSFIDSYKLAALMRRAMQVIVVPCRLHSARKAHVYFVTLSANEPGENNQNNPMTRAGYRCDG